MALTVSAVRQRIAGYLGAMSGWEELGLPYDLARSNPDKWRHKSFAVGVPSTRLLDQKQRTTATQAETELRVFWCSKVQVGSGPVDSYDSALALEAQLISALMAHQRSSGLRLTLESMSRSMSETWITGELVLRADHVVQLYSPPS